LHKEGGKKGILSVKFLKGMQLRKFNRIKGGHKIRVLYLWMKNWAMTKKWSSEIFRDRYRFSFWWRKKFLGFLRGRSQESRHLAPRCRHP